MMDRQLIILWRRLEKLEETVESLVTSNRRELAKIGRQIKKLFASIETFTPYKAPVTPLRRLKDHPRTNPGVSGEGDPCSCRDGSGIICKEHLSGEGGS